MVARAQGRDFSSYGDPITADDLKNLDFVFFRATNGDGSLTTAPGQGGPVKNGVDIHFVQANGEQLPFTDGSFDRVWGNAILHHLNLPTAGLELFRILVPGGIAVFAEPWGANPLLNWARDRAPYSGKERTPDERPIHREHVRLLRTIFPRVEVKGYQFLSMARRVFRLEGWMKKLDSLDQMLLSRIPRLQQYCRYVVLTLSR